jgi:prevent-host-death family protein
MRTVNIHEAKTHLSQLVEAAAAGESIILARAGKPLALLSPLPTVPPRRRGVLKGRIRLEADFDSPLPDAELRTFDGD